MMPEQHLFAYDLQDMANVSKVPDSKPQFCSAQPTHLQGLVACCLWLS